MFRRPVRSLPRVTLFALLLLAVGATPSSGQTPIAGSGLTLTALGNRQVRLTWQAGEGQAYFKLTRIAESGGSIVSLGPAETTFTDSLPIGSNVMCYQLHAYAPSGIQIARSFVQCFIPFGGYAMGFAMQYNPSVVPSELCPCPPPPTTNVSWSPVPAAAGYALLPLGTTRLQVLPGGSTGTMDVPGDWPVCYVAAPFNSSGLMGLSDILCGVPH
ncbi:MAG TPA: hypothetical protein VFC51_16625 [Chloroflexota bacterium]|nr:hypothetical protein [Chloroflexota bacterium]